MTNHTRMPAGTCGNEFYAQESGSDIVTDGTSWHPITIPAGYEYTRLLIQCQTTTPAFDIDSDLAGFRVSFSHTGPGVQADKMGTAIGIAFARKDTDTVVQYVQAPAGYKILCCLIS